MLQKGGAEMKREDSASESATPMCRRSFLHGILVAGAVVVGLGAAPLVACLTPGGEATCGGGADTTHGVSCDAETCAECPVQTATGARPVINAAKCVGCTKCVRIAQKTFAMDPRTEKAYVKNPTGDDAATIKKAVQACPTAAITLK